MNDARCLLLDEPMAGVEGQAYETMQSVVREVAGQGVAVCVVEHNVAFVRDLCDDAVFMFQGKILARGTVHGSDRQSAADRALFRPLTSAAERTAC